MPRPSARVPASKVWLVKTEPSEYSFDRLARAKRAIWDGVSNAQAIIHLRGMSEGDRVWVYHTGDEKAVVGLARVVRAAQPDPQRPGLTAKGEVKFVVVELEAVGPTARAVTLAEIKAHPGLKSFPLVTHSRLSVMPVSAAEDAVISALGGIG